MITKLVTKRGALATVATAVGGALLVGTVPAAATSPQQHSTAKAFRAPTVVAARHVLAVQGPASGRQTVVLDANERSVVKPGAVLVAGPGDATPHGLLVKVVSTRMSGAGVTAETVPAPLSAALAPGDYHKAIKISSPRTGGLQPNASTGPISWSLPITQIVRCNGTVTAEIDGSLQVNPSANVDLNIDLLGLHSASVSLSMSEDASLKATLSAAAHCTATVPIISNMPLGGFFIGPVFIEPSFSVTLDALLNANASVMISGAQHFRGSVGLSYDQNSGLQATKGASNTFDFAKPQLSGSATLEAGVTASVALMIEGLAGPRVDARGYLGITADSNTVPWWTLYGGVTVNGGLQVLGWNVGALTIWAQRWTLAQALGLVGSTLPTALPGSYYSQQVQAVGGTGPYSYAVTGGSLPAGLSLSPSGVISGMPTAPATTQSTSFVVAATDATGTSTSATYLMTVSGLSISSGSLLPAAAPAQDYLAALQAVGAIGTPTWRLVSGSLPAGLALAPNGVISGTAPPAPTTSTFTVAVSDATGRSVSKAMTLAVRIPRCGLMGCGG